MDLSITRITPETHEDRGAKGYDEGLGVNDHGLPEESPARKHWQAGWHQQRVARSRAHGNRAGRLLAQGCPP